MQNEECQTINYFLVRSSSLPWGLSIAQDSKENTLSIEDIIMLFQGVKTNLYRSTLKVKKM